MLLLSGTLRNATVRITPLSSWRMSSQQLLAASSRATVTSQLLAQPKEEDGPSEKVATSNKATITSNNQMVQEAFNNLKHMPNDPESQSELTIDQRRIKTSKNVQSLLSIVNEKSVTRENAFAIVSILLDWVNNGKAKLKDFEEDSKFLQLCTLLSQSKTADTETRNIPKPNKPERKKNFLDELHLFRNVNELNEAINEMATLPVQHVIKVLYGLAHQKRRSTPLLRALSFNINRSAETLNVKQLSDILYSMSVLNFADEVLLQKVCSDLLKLEARSLKTALVGSVLRSLGTLRYKDTELMDKISVWVVDNSKEIRPHDLCALFLTLAMVGYKPSNAEVLKKVVVDHLNETDMAKPSEWLDVVWSLTILQLVKKKHIASVLDSNFITKLTDSIETRTLTKHKLLNINAAAKLLIKDYKGPFLASDSNVHNVAVQRSKEKEVYVKTVLGTLDHIFPSPEYSQTNVNTGMGFLLDAEICVNSEGKRVPLKSNTNGTKGVRIAVMAQYYHDFCRGKQDPLGYNDFYCRILAAKGYKILTIPYTEFSGDDKIVQRIMYINDRVRQIAK